MPLIRNTIIAGSGVAGMTAALRLASSGRRVSIVEPCPLPGGRSFSIEDHISGESIDNGQHVMVGAYENYLKLLNWLGINDMLYQQEGLWVAFRGPGLREIFDTTKLPGSPGIALGLMSLTSVSLADKFRALAFMLKIKFHLAKAHDLNAYEFLRANGQSVEIIEILWEPMILATMNMSPQEASAEIFVTILRQAFLASADKARLIFPAGGFEKLYSRFRGILEKHNCQFISGDRVESVHIAGGHVTGLRLRSGRCINGDRAIIAAGPRNTHNILNNSGLGSEFSALADFSYSPIISLYLWTDRPLISEDFVAMLGSRAQWIFDRNKVNLRPQASISKFPFSYAVTISGADNLMKMKSSEIMNLVWDELNRIFVVAQKAQLKHYRVVRDKNATIKMTKSAAQNRPGQITAIEGLYLAGDYTATGLPATLESAAKSGLLAADMILEKDIWNK